MDTIVVGIDFSKSSLTAMKVSIDIAARANADLHIVWVETVEMPYDKAEETGFIETNELQEEYFNKAAEIFPNMQWEIVDGATHAFSGKAGERALEKCVNYLNENID